MIYYISFYNIIHIKDTLQNTKSLFIEAVRFLKNSFIIFTINFLQMANAIINNSLTFKTIFKN